MLEFRSVSGVKTGFRSGNELLRYEKLLFSAKKRILLLHTAEIRRKTQVRKPYCNLYAYGANNPVRYIDPDGETIYLIASVYNMSNYNGKSGNSSSVTIRKAGCYITAVANVIATAFTL